jgi:nitrogen-specific signal transduction histidine kinase
MGTGPLRGRGAQVKLKSAPTGDSRGARDSDVQLRRYQARDELEASQLKAALDCAADALLIADRSGRICAANTAAASLLDVEPLRLQCTYVQHYLAELDDGTGVLAAVADGPTAIGVALPDGRRGTARLKALADRNGVPTHVCIGLATDRGTGRDAALEAACRLVAEVAHDINNQLSAALNYVFILRRRLIADEQLAPHLEELQSTAWRAAALTAGLKRLGAKRTHEQEHVDLSEVLETLLPVLIRVAERCSIQLRLLPELPPIHAPRSHVEQLLLMITLSAVQRARGIGSVTIALEPRGRNVRVVWELAPAGDSRVVGLTSTTSQAGAGQGHSALRRALERCRARPGHSRSRIWIDLPAGV